MNRLPRHVDQGPRVFVVAPFHTSEHRVRDRRDGDQSSEASQAEEDDSCDF